MANSLQEIEYQMASHGIYLPSGHTLRVTDGHGYTRFKPSSGGWKKGKEAWYVIYEHRSSKGQPVYFGSYGIGMETYTIEHEFKGLSSEDKKRLQEEREANKRALMQSEKGRHELAVKNSQWKWDHATSPRLLSHPYVRMKSIKPVGARLYEGKHVEQIVIRMFRDSKLTGMQTITTEKSERSGLWETTKRFVQGSDTSGSYCPLGSFTGDVSVIYIVEGWATGCTVYEATKCPVVVAFDAGNLSSVSKEIHKKFPKSKIVFAADNDAHGKKRLLIEIRGDYKTDLIIAPSAKEAHDQDVNGTKLKAYYSKKDTIPCVVFLKKPEGQEKYSKRVVYNTGLHHATVAASELDGYGYVALPRFEDPDTEGTDFNDLATEEGIEVATEQLDVTRLKAQGPLPKTTSKEEQKTQSLSLINELGQRFILIKPTNTCWDLQDHEIVPNSWLRDCYGSETVNEWLQNTFGNRRQVNKNNLIFHPDGITPPNCVNMFKGWPLKPVFDDSKCQLICDHLYKLCGEDDHIHEWVLQWLAYPLQHPGAKMQTALLVYGETEGTGKSMFFDILLKIYGDYSYQINQIVMQSDFNGWVSQKLFVVADEVVTSQDRRYLKGVLKNLITSPKHVINEKNLPVRQEDNMTNFVFLSNEPVPLAMDMSDRRYMVIRFNEINSPEYFSALAKEIKNGGVEAFYGHLLKVDLTGFDPSTRPLDTPEHHDLKLLSGDPSTRFFEEWKNGDTDFPFTCVDADDAFFAFAAWQRKFSERFGMVNKKTFLERIKTKEGVCKKRINAEIYPYQWNPDEDTASPALKKKMFTVYFLNQKTLAECTDENGYIDKDKTSDAIRNFQKELYRAQLQSRK